MSIEQNTPDLEELERLLANATPGDWVAAAKPSRIVGWPIVSQQGRAIGSVNYVDPAGFAPANAALNDEAKANAALIVALRNAAPSLIATAREIEGLRAALSTAIGYVENTRIDLQCGTKAAGIKTIEGGIKRARAALGEAK